MLCLIVFLRELSGNLNRTEISEECLVEKSYFYYLGTSISEGGAIYKTTESALRILSSVFSVCSAQTAGGAVKAVGGNFDVSGTCLYYCYVRTVADNYFGNGIYVKSNTNIGLISFLKCGSSKESSADTSLYVLNGPSVIENANFSCCHGTGGASSVFFDSMISVSSMSYSNVAYGINACGIVFVPGISTTIRFMNMLHMRCYWQLNFVNQPNTVFVSCQYFNNTFSAFSGPSSATYTLCYSDYSGGPCTIATLFTHQVSPLSFEKCTFTLLPTSQKTFSSLSRQIFILALYLK